MNSLIIKLGLKAGMLNYVDNETPRHYFIRGNADEECLSQFAELIVNEAIGVVNKRYMGDNTREGMEVLHCVADLKEYFGIK